MSAEPQKSNEKSEEQKNEKPGCLGAIFTLFAGYALSVGILYLFYPQHAPTKGFICATTAFYFSLSASVATVNVIEGCVASSIWIILIGISIPVISRLTHDSFPEGPFWRFVVAEFVLVTFSTRVMHRLLVSCQLSSLQKEATFPKMRSAEAVH